jgi:hypothetical protein
MHDLILTKLRLLETKGYQFSVACSPDQWSVSDIEIGIVFQSPSVREVHAYLSECLVGTML